MKKKYMQILCSYVLCMSGLPEGGDMAFGRDVPTGFSQIVNRLDMYGIAETGADIEPVSYDMLSLEDAVQTALKSSLFLKQKAFDVQAVRASVQQAGLPLNPQFGVEVENFGGSKDFTGFDSAETTLLLEQTLELGGKRSYRTAVADYAAQVTEWEYVLEWLKVVEESSIWFAELCAARESMTLAENGLKIATKIHENVKERVDAGKDAPLEVIRARSLPAHAELVLMQAERRYREASGQLNLLWGECRVEWQDISMPVMDEPYPFAPEEVSARVETFPMIQHQRMRILQAEAAVESARARRVPDVAVAGGYKQSRADDAHMFVAGIGIELPLFDRNQGAVRAAEALLAKEHATEQVRIRDVRSLLSRRTKQLEEHAEAVALLRDRVVPAARAAFDAANTGYSAGKYDYMDVLDAQRAFIEAERELVETRLAYWKTLFEIDRLTGRRLASVPQSVE